MEDHQNGWSTWHSLGGQLAAGTGPAVASWSAGRLDVFVEGTNGALYHKWYSGGAWSSWQNLGGKLTASPAATFDMSVLSPANSIWVFVRGTDGAVWQKVWNGTASAWSNGPSRRASRPQHRTSREPNPRTLVQGTDHQLWHRNHGGSWSSWATLGGKPLSRCPLPLRPPSPTLTSTPRFVSAPLAGTSGIAENDVTGLWPRYTWSSISGPP